MQSESWKGLVCDLYQSAGILGALDAFESERISDADREVIRPLIEKIIPAQILECGATRYQREISREIGRLIDEEETNEFVLVGPPDAALLKALALERFRGRLRVILSGEISQTDASRMRRNVPRGLSIEFELPTRRLPTITVNDTIVTVGFDAGANMVLIDRQAPSVLSQLGRRGDSGSAVLLQPDLGFPVFERTTVLTSASRKMFRFDRELQPEALDAPVN